MFALISLALFYMAYQRWNNRGEDKDNMELGKVLSLSITAGICLLFATLNVADFFNNLSANMAMKTYSFDLVVLTGGGLMWVISMALSYDRFQRFKEHEEILSEIA